MGMIIDRSIMILAYVLILSSYKKKIKIQKYCIFYFTYSVFSILLECILNGVIGTIEIIALKFVLCYALLRIIMGKSSNILDLFFLVYEFFIYLLLKKYISSVIVFYCVVLVAVIICKTFQTLLFRFYCSIIELWNRGEDKALTLRCAMLILLCITICGIYMII